MRVLLLRTRRVVEVDESSGMTMIRLGVAEVVVEPVETATVRADREMVAAAPPPYDDEDGVW